MTERELLEKEYRMLMRRIEEKLADVNCYVTKAEADRREELERLLGITIDERPR